MASTHFDETLLPWFRAKLKPNALSVSSLLSTTLIPLCVALVSVVFVIAQSYLNDTAPKPAGCRPIGMRKGSHLDDELDPRYLEGSSESSGTWRIKSILLYPIKSCQAVELEKAEVLSTGFKYDRQFSFAQLKSPFPVSASDSEETKSAHQWKFVTQREFPLMSQVRTEVWVPDPNVPGYKPDLPFVVTGGAIVVIFPWQADGWQGILDSLVAKLRGGIPEKSFLIPFQPTEEQVKRDYTQEKFTIWKETVDATNMGVHVPPELKYFLGVRNPFALFRVSKDREVFRAAPRKEEAGYQPITGFADAFPLHLLGVSSTQELSNDQTPGSPPLSVIRFRPNIVVEGMGPYEEETWKKINIGGQLYYVACRCVRCGIPNINPKTGGVHRVEPNKTLRATRNVDAGAPKLGCLGMNVVPGRLASTMSVGDKIEVLERGEHVYIKM